MSLTSRKKRPLSRVNGTLRDACLIIIATEGKETENQYFEIFHSTRVQIKIMPTDNGKSSPNHVFERLNEYKKEFELGPSDQLWLMVDTDRWPVRSLSEIAAESHRKSFQMAVSNPCFELWLYLHCADIGPGQVFIRCDDVEQELRIILGGYNSSNINIDSFFPHIREAARRARVLDTNPQERWPSNTGTHVYRVVEEILRLVPNAI